MIRTSHARPVYREVLNEAIQTAWKDKRYWIFSLVAGFLFSAGSYDVLWNSLSNVSQSISTSSTNVGSTLIQNAILAGQSGWQNIFSVASALELLIALVMLMLALGVASCMSEGALVFALGARKLGHEPRFKEAMHVGGQNIWPIIVLNIFFLGLTWVLRFIITVPVASLTSLAPDYASLITALSLIVFGALALFLCIIHIFTLNAMILQGASLAEGIERAVFVFKEHWLITLETAVIQIAASIGIGAVFIIALACLLFPAYLLFVVSAMAGSGPLFGLSMMLMGLIFVVGGLITLAFVIQFQYATWIYLYRRLGEGGALPKVHRLARSVFGVFRVPQS